MFINNYGCDMRIRRRYLVLLLFSGLLISFSAAVLYLNTPCSLRVEDVLQIVSENRWPELEDDLDLTSLGLALERNLGYLGKLSGEYTLQADSKLFVNLE
jgi:hypothetical protein